MNSDRPIRIWLGGNCCVPSAWRSSDSTMTMRVKLVIMIRIAGASDSTVSRMMICMAAEKFSRLVRSGSWEGKDRRGGRRRVAEGGDRLGVGESAANGQENELGDRADQPPPSWTDESIHSHRASLTGPSVAGSHGEVRRRLRTVGIVSRRGGLFPSVHSVRPAYCRSRPFRVNRPAGVPDGPGRQRVRPTRICPLPAGTANRRLG